MKKFSIVFVSSLLLLASCLTPPSEPVGTKPTAKRVPTINNPLPDGFIDLLESFEDENFWQAGEFEAEVSDEWSTDGQFSGEWTFDSITDGSCAEFCCEAPALTDWSGTKFLIANINNTTQEPLAISLELECGPAHEKSVTDFIDLGIGENLNVCFDLLHCPIDSYGADDVRKISFVISEAKFGGIIYIDSIRLVR